ncbi:MAG: hypothetical protein RLZZ323_332 [Bacteroidota bacterium]|jgi:uncharacterized membrane protein YhaH (DUF805 family)
MKYFNLFRYYYSDLNGKSGRLEFGIYLLVNTIANLFVLYLVKNTDWGNKTVINLFYYLIIWNIIFVPHFAVTTRRLNDLAKNRMLIIFNFIPVIRIFFSLFLLFKKTKKT